MNRRSFLASTAIAGAGTLADLAPAQAAEGKFQLGSVTYNLLQNMDLETCIKTLEKAGFAAVELRTGHKHGVEPSIDAAARAGTPPDPGAMYHIGLLARLIPAIIGALTAPVLVAVLSLSYDVLVRGGGPQDRN
jgi:hypothetical protein